MSITYQTRHESYFQRRERQEREAASAAASDAARHIHLVLAERYAVLSRH